MIIKQEEQKNKINNNNKEMISLYRKNDELYKELEIVQKDYAKYIKNSTFYN
jgi:hypothetical protein